MHHNTLGVIGLSVMGGNLAMNMADAGFSVAVYNRSREKTDALVASYAGGAGRLQPYFDIAPFVASLALPRKILLMVAAGEAVDAVIDQLVPLLAEGDVVIDGGNSFFKDTIRREIRLREQGLHFVGMGVSGGEEGARRGPSMMPGGSQEAWEQIRPIMEKIAAKDFSGGACVAHIGSDGAGHYVKMVHNGIEYIDMQLIVEAYSIMKRGLGMDNEAIADVLAGWNQGRLNSFLIEITEKILRTKDADGAYVVDTILDTAGSKGTGMWTAQEAIALGVPAHAMTAALFARYGSSSKKARVDLARIYPHTEASVPVTVEQLEQALYAAKLLAYAQGFDLLSVAAATYGWALNLPEMARIWQGGCIIRARFLQKLAETFAHAKTYDHILELPLFVSTLREESATLRLVASAVMRSGLPVPAMLGSLTYFESMTQAVSNANIIQAQRDFFGAHGFQKELGGASFHFPWTD
jgi:6-phosphogluconate dehydrogenase